MHARTGMEERGKPQSGNRGEKDGLIQPVSAVSLRPEVSARCVRNGWTRPPVLWSWPLFGRWRSVLAISCRKNTARSCST
jgi:hypothetical protein